MLRIAIASSGLNFDNTKVSIPVQNTESRVYKLVVDKLSLNDLGIKTS